MLDNKGFDLWADGYDKAVGISDEENSYPFAGYKEVLGSIFRQVMEKPHPTVLDIGFGTGTLTAKLYEQGCTVFGQDFSERMTALAAAKMPDAQLFTGDFAEGLASPLLERSYDFIIATYSLHHLTDEQKIGFIGSLKSLLNDGGELLIGDVAFADRGELDSCREQAGDEWDDEEYYFVFDELKRAIPGLRFTKTSFCAGILTLEKESVPAANRGTAGFRRFRETDYDAVCDFLIALNKRDRGHINWNWARFEWMYGHPEFDLSLADSIGLWFDGSRVVGAAIYDMYFGEAFCGVLSGYETLYPEVLDYAYRELADDSGLGIAICDTNESEIAAAMRAGFFPAEQDETIMSIGLAHPFESALPDGLHFGWIGPDTDKEALKWFFWQAFDHGCDRDEFEHSEQNDARERRHFNRELSVAALTDGGEPAAYCCLWFADGTDYAYVEPVCTIPAWRGKGAARAVVFEALERARLLGAKIAYVISDLAFYEKLGFKKELHFTFYWKRPPKNE